MLLLCGLQHNKIYKNGENRGSNPQKKQIHTSKLVKVIVPLTIPEKDELDALDFINNMFHNTPRYTTS